MKTFQQLLAVSGLAATTLLVHMRPAAACSPPPGCAESFCVGETTYLEATLLDLGTVSGDYATTRFEIHAIHGDAAAFVVGEDVVRSPEYVFWSESVGGRFLLGVEGSGDAAVVRSVVRGDDTFLAFCLAQPEGAVDLAAAAAVLLSPSCDATLAANEEAATAGEPKADAPVAYCALPTGCQAGGASGGGAAALLGLALVGLRRRRR